MDMDAIEEEDQQHEVIEKNTEKETETGHDDSDHFALPFEEPQEKVIETVEDNIESKEELVPAPKTPEVEPVPTTPLRRSSRKGSRSQDDLMRAETLPLDKTPRKPKTAPAPEVDLETIEEEKSVTKASTEPVAEMEESTAEQQEAEPTVTPTLENLPETKSARSKRTSSSKTVETLLER